MIVAEVPAHLDCMKQPLHGLNAIIWLSGVKDRGSQTGNLLAASVEKVRS